ncbi:hypothetical protein LguiA_002888 [Lonicera macranthoides]
MQVLWDQLAPSEPVWHCTTDAAKFEIYKSQQQVMTLLMALHDRFEPVRASLLHRHPLSTFDDTITTLHFEETRLGSNPQASNGVLAVTHSKLEKTSNECTYCHETNHILLYCPKRVCKFCRKRGPKHYGSDCYKNPARQTSSRPSTVAAAIQTLSNPSPPVTNNDLAEMLKQVLSGPNTAAAAIQTLSNPSPPVTNNDLAEMLKQVLSGPSNALSTTSGTGSKDESDYWDRP